MILVTGSTGNNGTQIVRRLAAQRVPVRTLVRDVKKEAGKVAEMKAMGVEIAEAGLAKPESLRAALEDIEAALLLSPVNPNTVELQGNFVRGAKWPDSLSCSSEKAQVSDGRSKTIRSLLP